MVVTDKSSAQNTFVSAVTDPLTSKTSTIQLVGPYLKLSTGSNLVVSAQPATDGTSSVTVYAPDNTQGWLGTNTGSYEAFINYLTVSVAAASGALTSIQVTGATLGAGSSYYNSVTFTMPAGQGVANVSLSLAVGSAAGPSLSAGPFYLTYASPTITSINPSTSIAITGTTLTIVGTNFGTDSASVSVSACSTSPSFCEVCTVLTLVSSSNTITVRGLDCFASRGWAPPSRPLYAQCTLPAGAGSRSITVKVAGQTSTNSLSVSYVPPTVTSITPVDTNLAATVPVNITGTNLGLSTQAVAVTIGGQTCASAAVTTNNTVISCLAPHGAGSGYPVVVTVGGGVQASGITFNFNSPTVTSATTSTIFGSLITVTVCMTMLGSLGRRRLLFNRMELNPFRREQTLGRPVPCSRAIPPLS